MNDIGSKDGVVAYEPMMKGKNKKRLDHQTFKKLIIFFRCKKNSDLKSSCTLDLNNFTCVMYLIYLR